MTPSTPVDGDELARLAASHLRILLGDDDDVRFVLGRHDFKLTLRGRLLLRILRNGLQDLEAPRRYRPRQSLP